MGQIPTGTHEHPAMCQRKPRREEYHVSGRAMRNICPLDRICPKLEIERMHCDIAVAPKNAVRQ